MFDGTLGTWKKYPVDFKLKENVKTILLRQYPAPKVHNKNFKNEVDCLVLLGFLEVTNESELVSPYFAQTKPKSNQVRLLS